MISMNSANNFQFTIFYSDRHESVYNGRKETTIIRKDGSVEGLVRREVFIRIFTRSWMRPHPKDVGRTRQCTCLHAPSAMRVRSFMRVSACLRWDVATQVGMQFRNARVAHEASSPSPSEGLLTGRNRDWGEARCYQEGTRWNSLDSPSFFSSTALHFSFFFFPFPSSFFSRNKF